MVNPSPIPKADPQNFIPSYSKKWDIRSSIRTRPIKYIDFSLPGYFFPPDKQPLLLNNDVKSLGTEVKEKILRYSLFKYLHDINHLEIQLINKACNAIIYQDLGIKFLPQQQMSAYTVLIDEYYHVYLARLMMEQLKQKDSDLEHLTFPFSDSYLAVLEIEKQLDEKYHAIFEVLAVCIFETTLVRELVSFFNGKDVHPSIKYYVNDHMNDDSRHYAYFYDLLIYTWNALNEEYKTEIGLLMGQFVTLYLNVASDKAFNFELLTKLFFDHSKADLIINDLYKGFAITPEVPIVKNVLRVLKDTGILAHLAVQSSFKELGWNI